jgi:hypothetical protein
MKVKLKTPLSTHKVTNNPKEDLLVMFLLLIMDMGKPSLVARQWGAPPGQKCW